MLDTITKALAEGFGWQNFVMYGIGILLIWLAIKKEMEPSLLLPMGFGTILVNLPLSGVLTRTIEGVTQEFALDGLIDALYNIGIEGAELFPLLLFIGIGAMIDFGPLLSQPIMFLFGAAAQFGIFAAILVAVLFGFDLKDAASIGIIGAADGPTAILVSKSLGSAFESQITVAAYSYMALVPIIQPIAIRLVTTKKERQIRMPYVADNVTKSMKIAFPIVVTIIVGFVSPMSISLVGTLMFGNLLRECGVLENLSQTAQTTLANLVTLLLGFTISRNMVADKFLVPQTILIIIIGLFAFVFDSMAGCLFVKFLNLFRKSKINPMIGAAGISAFPMSSRVVQKMALEEDPGNILIMQAAGANVSGQIASVVAGGLVMNIVMSMM